MSLFNSIESDGFLQKCPFYWIEKRLNTNIAACFNLFSNRFDQNIQKKFPKYPSIFIKKDEKNCEKTVRKDLVVVSQ